MRLLPDDIGPVTEGRGSMDRIVERCARLDVHKDSVIAGVRVPGEGERARLG